MPKTKTYDITPNWPAVNQFFAQAIADEFNGTTLGCAIMPGDQGVIGLIETETGYKLVRGYKGGWEVLYTKSAAVNHWADVKEDAYIYGELLKGFWVTSFAQGPKEE